MIKKENKLYFNKIITVLFTNIYILGFKRGKNNVEIDELERMWNLPCKDNGDVIMANSLEKAAKDMGLKI